MSRRDRHGTLFLWLWPAGVTRVGRSRRHRPQIHPGDWRHEADMERTDWLDGGFDAREARFLMVTAITHHQFSSPIWGEDEVRKLQAELAEIELTASRAYVEHDAAAVRRGWAQAPPRRAATGRARDRVTMRRRRGVIPATSNAAVSSLLPHLPRALPASR